MTPNWTRQALADITAVDAWLRQRDVGAADRMIARVLALVTGPLIQHPFMGRPGRVATTRELVVHRTYILVYRVAGDRIDILAFRRTAQLWPETL
jgi:toxin ParE1/3/4